jgi:hypothetical protein
MRLQVEAPYGLRLGILALLLQGQRILPLARCVGGGLSCRVGSGQGQRYREWEADSM